KPIRSDFAIWSARITYRSNDINSSYSSVKNGTDRLVAFLKKSGFDDAEVVRGALSTKKLYAQTTGKEITREDTFRTIAGYDVTQSVEVRSGKVDKVDEISRTSTELLGQGIALESDPPQYLYTKISEVKREILGSAAEDAFRRARQVAEKSGASVGKLRGVRMSPLQITSAFSSEISSEGQNDTSSIDKAITAIVTATFEVK
ncbi:MAG: SIMPL domain-containing protein, partial [Armatimonadota bacterium]